MNKRIPAFAGALALVLIVFWLCQSAAAADGTDLYHESLKFDSNGNLLMTTRDKRAESNVRYKTIGWTIKRTRDAIEETQSVRLRLEQNGASCVDPSDADYIFTYFKCAKEVIFAKIGSASEKWQRTLYKNGGIVYLDAIMTVVEHGRQLGYMDENGTLYGEVYTTAGGIINARDWADAGALRTHYNKALSFPPIPDMVSQEEENNEKRLRIRYGKEECAENNTVRIRSSEFEVTKSIPTGESVKTDGELQKYYYAGILAHHYGSVSVPVEIRVTYTYPIETENGIIRGSFTSAETYYVSRNYSYYRIDELNLYTLWGLEVENEALPVFPLEFRKLYQADVTLVRDRDSYMKIPTFRTSVYGGDIADGDCISGQELAQLAERTAGEVWVQNDELVIDGEVILDGSLTQRSTSGPKQPSGARLQPFSGENLTIPHTKRNDSYHTYAVALYQNVFSGGREAQVVKHRNPVVVHTPVTCKGGITDDIAHNQQVSPTPYFSLILGRSFTVGVSTIGTHKKEKGYGTRDYEKYVALRQVRFPFEVYDGTVHYEKHVWIDLPPEQKSFYLPVGVHEGNYRIRYRTIAKNADAERGGRGQNGYLANRKQSEYSAYDELTVTVIGRMYDLAITDIVDYPRWRNVFYRSDGSKKGYAVRVGRQNLEGTMLAERAADGVFPVLAGDHPFYPLAGAVGLGYRIKLRLKTVGDLRGSDDKIVMIPTYYYVSRDGSKRQQVRLYRKRDLTEVSRLLVLADKNRSFLPVPARNVTDPLLRAQSVQVWDGEYQLSPDLYLVAADIDLDRYIRQRGGRIGQKDPIFLQGGYLLVRFEIRSYHENAAHLSYANSDNSSRGYCNMWRMQGFFYARTDRFGNVFTFTDGDCLLFDTKNTLHRDYESRGTH